MKIKKQRKKWKTKDGRKIRICNMDDSHLYNAIEMLERLAEGMTINAMDACILAMQTMQGEEAINSVESELDRLTFGGIDPSEVNPLYDDLLLEQERRRIKMEKQEEKRNSEKKTENVSFYVAGVQHHDLSSVIDDMVEEEPLDLVPEPTNPYDSNAVRIEYKGVMIGYVPKRISAAITARITDPEVEVSCETERINREEHPWKQCYVTIHVEDK